MKVETLVSNKLSMTANIKRLLSTILIRFFYKHCLMFSTTLVLQNVLFLKERFPIFFSKLLLLSKESQLKVLESLAYLRS